jgi:TM2 domain-containing membrane protein YozV
MRNRGLAVVFAIFLGGLGIHRFYVGRFATGLLYLFFFWTFIPAILGFIEAIRWMVMSEDTFQRKYATEPAGAGHARQAV